MYCASFFENSLFLSRPHWLNEACCYISQLSPKAQLHYSPSSLFHWEEFWQFLVYPFYAPHFTHTHALSGSAMAQWLGESRSSCVDVLMFMMSVCTAFATEGKASH